MGLKSTIFKASLQIADIDHGYYADHTLTLARHPSETDERMMVRLAALALNAHALQTVCGGDGTLAFGAGLSDPDEPDAWLRDFTPRTRGEIRIAPGGSGSILYYSLRFQIEFNFRDAKQFWGFEDFMNVTPPGVP